MKYRIMHDYGSYEGFNFYSDKENIPLEYETIGEAIKAGMNAGYSTPFIVVHVIDWETLVIKLT